MTDGQATARQATTILAGLVILAAAILACQPGEPDQPPRPAGDAPALDLVAGAATNTPTATPTATPTLTPTPIPPTPTPVPPTPVPPPRVEAQSGGGAGWVIATYIAAMWDAELRYGLPRGVVAAMYEAESGGHPGNCPGFNCTGIGVNSPSGMPRYGSYEEGIEATAALITSYPDATIDAKLCRWQSGTGHSTCAYSQRVLGYAAKYQ